MRQLFLSVFIITLFAGCNLIQPATVTNTTNTVVTNNNNVTSNTTTPTNTVVSNEKTWLAYFPTQCNTVPWEKSYTTSTIQDYFLANYNITIYDVDDVAAASDYMTCSACGCPTGRIVKVQVSVSMVEQMLELGFEEQLTADGIIPDDSIEDDVNATVDSDAAAAAEADAADVELRNRAETVQQALANYYSKNKSYPDTLEPLQLTVDVTHMNYTPIGTTPADYYDLSLELTTGTEVLNP